MKRFANVVYFSSQELEDLVRDGVTFIEVSDNGYVWLWHSGCFIPDDAKLVSPIVFDDGCYLPSGFIYSLPSL